MNKNEFMKELPERIKSLPQSEIDRLMAYYDEVISDRMEDGMDEEAAVAAVGSLDKIAEEAMLDMSIPTLMKAKINESKDKSGNKKVWTILAIVGSPVWLPLMIAAAAVVFSVYISIWAVVVSLYAAVISFGAGALAGIVVGGVRLVEMSAGSGLAVIGMGLVCCGLMFLTYNPVVKLSKSLVKLTGRFMKWMKSIIIGKKSDQNNDATKERQV